MSDIKYLKNVRNDYAGVREELLKFGRSVKANNLAGGNADYPEDRLLWIYDLLAQLSMLEIACAKEEIAADDIDCIREFAAVTGHGNILDVINGYFLNEYREKSGNNDREFRWEDIEKADVAAVRRMVVALKRNLLPLTDEFSDMYSTVAAANGIGDIKKLESFTMDLLVAFASVDGEITLEEEDKTGDCSVVKLLNATARKIAGFVG